MKSITLTIQNDVGLHARPSALLVSMASKYSSDIYLVCDDKKANAKSMTLVLALGVRKGMQITVEANGEDEDKAIHSICALIESNFDERIVLH